MISNYDVTETISLYFSFQKAPNHWGSIYKFVYHSWTKTEYNSADIDK